MLSFTEKEQTYPALQHAAVTRKQLWIYIQMHCAYAKMQSEVQSTHVTEITCKLTFNKGISYYYYSGSTAEQKQCC